MLIYHLHTFTVLYLPFSLRSVCVQRGYASWHRPHAGLHNELFGGWYRYFGVLQVHIGPHTGRDGVRAQPPAGPPNGLFCGGFRLLLLPPVEPTFDIIFSNLGTTIHTICAHARTRTKCFPSPPLAGPTFLSRSMSCPMAVRLH